MSRLIIRFVLILILIVLIYTKACIKENKEFDYKSASIEVCKCLTPILKVLSDMTENHEEINDSDGRLKIKRTQFVLEQKGIECIEVMKEKYGHEYDPEKLREANSKYCPFVHEKLESRSKADESK